MTDTTEDGSTYFRRATYYPKCRAILSIVFDGFGGSDSEPTIVQVIPRSAQVYLNGYKEADTWELEFDAKALPISPDLIRSLAAEIYIFDSGSTGSDLSAFATDEHRLVTGLADNAEMSYGKEGRVFRVDGRDYTGLLLDRQWDPKVKVPSGVLLTKAVQKLVDDGVGAAKHGGRTLTVKWVSDDPIPVVGATSTKTKKNGQPVKDGSSFWDVIYRLVLREGKIVFVRGFEVVITDPQTMTLQSAAQTAKVAYGRNLSTLKVERKLGKEKTPQCKVVSYDPTTRTAISAVFPERKDPVKTGVGTNKEEVQVFTVRGIQDRTALKKHAEAMYNNLARAEAKAQFTTKSLTDLSEVEVSLLRLRAGQPISVSFDPFNVELLEEMPTADQRYRYLLTQGYSSQVAALVADSYELVDQFRRPLYVREVGVSWSHQEGITLDIEAMNFVVPDRDDQTAFTKNMTQLSGTVETGLANTQGDTLSEALTDMTDQLRDEEWITP
jgi:hypothetical protein